MWFECDTFCDSQVWKESERKSKRKRKSASREREPRGLDNGQNTITNKN